jgi:hypothetical protein
LGVFSPAAMACAVCFGKSDSDMAKAMNWGIFALLTVIVSVLGSAAAFFVCLARRASAYAAANADSQDSLNDVEIKSGAS